MKQKQNMNNIFYKPSKRRVMFSCLCLALLLQLTNCFRLKFNETINRNMFEEMKRPRQQRQIRNVANHRLCLPNTATTHYRGKIEKSQKSITLQLLEPDYKFNMKIVVEFKCVKCWIRRFKSIFTETLTSENVFSINENRPPTWNSVTISVINSNNNWGLSLKTSSGQNIEKFPKSPIETWRNFIKMTILIEPKLHLYEGQAIHDCERYYPSTPAVTTRNY